MAGMHPDSVEAHLFIHHGDSSDCESGFFPLINA